MPLLAQFSLARILWEYRGRLFELLDSYSPTNTVDAYSSCCIVIADEYRGRLFELLDPYLPDEYRGFDH